MTLIFHTYQRLRTDKLVKIAGMTDNQESQDWLTLQSCRTGEHSKILQRTDIQDLQYWQTFQNGRVAGLTNIQELQSWLTLSRCGSNKHPWVARLTGIPEIGTDGCPKVAGLMDIPESKDNADLQDCQTFHSCGRLSVTMTIQLWYSCPVSVLSFYHWRSCYPQTFTSEVYRCF